MVSTLRHVCKLPREIQVLPSSTLQLGTDLFSMPLHFATASSRRWINSKFFASRCFLFPEPFEGGEAAFSKHGTIWFSAKICTRVLVRRNDHARAPIPYYAAFNGAQMAWVAGLGSSFALAAAS